MDSKNDELTRIEQVDPTRSEVREVISLLDAHNTGICPPETCHLDPPEVLAEANCFFFAAYHQDSICGIGALKVFDGYGEVKRMYVIEEYRKLGVAQLILDRLISVAKECNLPSIKLETSELFMPAVHFYRKNGFQECGAFGPYIDSYQNMFMEKVLR